MKRIVRLTLALGTVGLLALLLILAVGAQPAAHAAGDTIKVPDDYPTIQAAIDAAEEGDEIWVAEGAYYENLSIPKGITLSGGWYDDFTTRIPGGSTIDGQGLGRVISITCASSDTVVTIDGFTVQSGNATGLGGLTATLSEALESPLYGAETQSSPPAPDPLTPAEHAALLRTHLADVAARGLYPGGLAAYQATLRRVDRQIARLEGSQARPRATKDSSQQSADCGGGIYSWNASLHLLNSTVLGNVASLAGDGCGGGVFVGQAPPSGTIIAGNTLQENIASAVYAALGRGGGLYVLQAPGVVIEDNVFYLNAASDAGILSAGLGGGLLVEASPNTVLRGNQVARNTANAGWEAMVGIGGGAYLSEVDGVTVADNVFRENLAMLHGSGGGGGLYVERSADVLVTGNEVAKNWGCLFQADRTSAGGGGIALLHIGVLTVTHNTIWGNTGSVYGAQVGFSTGGGLDGQIWYDARITGNTITGNVACHIGIGWGGGVSLWGTEDVEVAENTIADNVASLSEAYGSGGGLLLLNTENCTVRHNRFQGNLAAADGEGHGGGLRIEGQGPKSFDTTVDANLFMNNKASANPAVPSDGGGCAVGTDGFTFTNNVVAGNTATEGGGLDLAYAARGVVINNTFVGNSDAGVSVEEWNTTPITFTNNIVVSHTVGISVSEGATATVRYTLWHGNATDIGGAGTISHTHPVIGNPAFVDPATDDYHLTIGSAARDAGEPAGVPPAPPEDLDGIARPQGPAVDLGAYEWRGHWLYVPLVAKSFTPRTGWAIGHDATGTAVIVHTADGGLTWEVQGDSTAWSGLGGNDISAVDDRTAWAALGSGPGETGGDILHTTDGGATWVSQTIPPGLAGGIKGVKGLSRDEAWAASLGGVILHTTDGGATWNITPHPTAPISEVNRMDAMGTNVWVADSATGGAVVHTEDGGITWRAEYLPNDYPLTVHAFSPMAVWSSGVSGVIFYRTVNGGDQWDHAATVGGFDHLDDICAAGADDVWGVQNGDGVSGFIFRVHVAADGTPDAKNITPPELGGYMPGGVTCLDTRVAWVVATKGIPPDPTKPLGIILHTVDGEHWVQQSAPTHVNYWKASFVGARR